MRYLELLPPVRAWLRIDCNCRIALRQRSGFGRAGRSCLRRGVADRPFGFRDMDTVHFETRYRFGQRIGFGGQSMAGSGGFFEHRRVLLRYMIQFVDRRVDLRQAAGLLTRRGRDVRHPI